MRLNRILLVATWVTLACLLACSSDPSSPSVPTKSGPYSWVTTDTIGSGGRVSAVYGAAPGDVYFATVSLDRFGDGWSIFPPGRVNRYVGSQWVYDRGFTPTTHPTGLWASSPNDVYLADGELHHWDGASWKDLGVPVNRLFGVSATDIYGASSWNDRRVFHYDGSRWTLLRDFGTDNNDPLYDLFAFATPFLVVVRSNGVSMWDGTQWKEYAFGYDDLYDVWGSAPDNLYVVGDPYSTNAKLAHFNGTAWTDEVIPTIPALRSIWGSSASDIYAAGEKGAMLHFDGVSWGKVRSSTCKRIGDIWGTGPADIFAVGDDGEVLHSSGGAWSSIGKQSPDEHVTGIWAESATQFAVTNWLDCGTLYLYEGGKWAVQKMDTDESVSSIGGRSLHDLWASAGQTMFHFDGTGWDRSINVGFSAREIWVPDVPSPPVAVAGQNVFQFDGFSWTPVLDTSPDDAIALWGSGPVVYAISRELVYRYDGNSWRNIPAPNGHLVDIAGVSASEVYVLTSNTKGLGMSRFDGTTWHSMAAPRYGDHLAVNAANNMLTWGYGCFVSRFDGQSWTNECDPKNSPVAITTTMDGSILRLTEHNVSRQEIRPGL